MRVKFLKFTSVFVYRFIFALFFAANLMTAQTANSQNATGLTCPAAAAIGGCNAGDISSVTFTTLSVTDACDFPGDTATAQIRVDWSSNSTNYDLSYAYNALSGGVAGGAAAACSQTYIGAEVPGGGSQTVTMTFACADQNNNGTVDVSALFNWEKNKTHQSVYRQVEQVFR